MAAFDMKTSKEIIKRNVSELQSDEENLTNKKHRGESYAASSSVQAAAASSSVQAAAASSSVQAAAASSSVQANKIGTVDSLDEDEKVSPPKKSATEIRTSGQEIFIKEAESAVNASVALATLVAALSNKSAEIDFAAASTAASKTVMFINALADKIKMVVNNSIRMRANTPATNLLLAQVRKRLTPGIKYVSDASGQTKYINLVTLNTLIAPLPQNSEKLSFMVTPELKAQVPFFSNMNIGETSDIQNSPYMKELLEFNGNLPENYCAEAAIYTTVYLGLDCKYIFEMLLRIIGNNQVLFDLWFEMVAPRLYKIRQLVVIGAESREQLWGRIARREVLTQLKSRYQCEQFNPAMLFALCTQPRPAEAASCSNIDIYHIALQRHNHVFSNEHAGAAATAGQVKMLDYFYKSNKLKDPVGNYTDLAHNSDWNGRLNTISSERMQIAQYVCLSAIMGDAVNVLDWVQTSYPKYEIYSDKQILLMARYAVSCKAFKTIKLLLTKNAAQVRNYEVLATTIKYGHIEVLELIYSENIPLPLTNFNEHDFDSHYMSSLYEGQKINILEFLRKKGLVLYQDGSSINSLTDESVYASTPNGVPPILLYAVESRLLANPVVIFNVLFYRTLLLGNEIHITWIFKICREFLEKEVLTRNNFDLSKKTQENIGNNYHFIGKKLKDLYDIKQVQAIPPLICAIYRNSPMIFNLCLKMNLPFYEKLINNPAVCELAINCNSVGALALLRAHRFVWNSEVWVRVAISISNDVTNSDKIKSIMNYLIEQNAPWHINTYQRIMEIMYDKSDTHRYTGLVRESIGNYIVTLWKSGRRGTLSITDAMHALSPELVNLLIADGQKPNNSMLVTACDKKICEIPTRIIKIGDAAICFWKLAKELGVKPSEDDIALILSRGSAKVEYILRDDTIKIDEKILAKAIVHDGFNHTQLSKILAARNIPKDEKLTTMVLTRSTTARKTLLKILLKAGFSPSAQVLAAALKYKDIKEVLDADAAEKAAMPK
jgi:hypothetical protein